MRFHELGEPSRPHVMLIHGGGSAWWGYLRQARVLAERYHVILPNLDGHGEERDRPYRSTAASAEQLLAYVDRTCGGRLHLLGGVSLGGQIAMEMLARRAEAAEKAIIDGSLCLPQPRMAAACMAMVRLFYPLMFSRPACRAQMALLRRIPSLRFPRELEEYYVRDVSRLPRETLLTMYRTYMAEYRLPDGIRRTRARVMYWYGERELNCVKESAAWFQKLVSSCTRYEAKGCQHGVLALYRPEEWLRAALPFLEA